MYIPHNEKDRRLMLENLGISSVEELFSSIPSFLRLKGELNLPPPMSELELSKHLLELAKKNISLLDYTSFLGGGIYDHYIPPIIDQLLLRSEFYTAYTPYQPEVSQGTLQATFEYQSLICDLFQMEVSNASVYDGGSALAEACHMAMEIKKKKKVLISKGVNPFYINVIKTYAEGLELAIEFIPLLEGVSDLQFLKEKIDDETCAVVFQQPNFFGLLEDCFGIEEITHQKDAFLIVSCDPISLSILAPPGSYNADIAVGEGQALGLYPSFGGPLLGIFTAKKEFIRQMPGRIVGQTIDAEGKTGYVTVLQTREQHIRREKATSNICTNQNLCALRAAIYLSIMGKNGLKAVANLCLQKSHYLLNELEKVTYLKKAFNKPHFKEFVVLSEIPVEKILSFCQKNRIFAGLPLNNPLFKTINDNLPSNALLIAVTEKRTKEEMDRFVSLLKEVKEI